MRNPPVTLPPVSRRVTAPRYCQLEADSSGRETLHVSAVGRELCNVDYRVSRGGFPCHGVEFVASGTGRVWLNGHPFPLRAGTVFCYGPSTRHEIVNEGRGPMVKYFVDFAGPEAPTLLRTGKLQPGTVVHTGEGEGLLAVFERLLEEGAARRPHAARICAGYVRILVLKADQAIPARGNAPSGTAAHFARCRDLLDAEFLTLRDLGEVAARLGLSPGYLCRIFREYGQPSPFRSLTRRKMDRAMELLLAENASVKAAALAVGYEDPYHFSRLFKAHFGHAPAYFLKHSHRAEGR